VKKAFSFLALFSLAGSAFAKIEPFDVFSLSKALQDPAFSKAADLFLANRFADLGSLCEGRLTLQSGEPYEIFFIGGATTIYFTPFTGSAIALYTGTRWQLLNFTETSLAPSLSASQVYDVFGYNNSGTLALELSAAWTSSTVRSEALTKVGGVYVKSANNTRRYLGTIATNSSSQIDDGPTSRGVWNQCNRKRTVVLVEASTSHSYNGGYRYFNNDSTRRIDVVVGLTSGYDIHTELQRSATATAYAGIGLDSSTVPIVETSSNELGNYAISQAMIASVLTQGTHSFNVINSTNSSGSMDVYYQKVQGWMEF
jgi:hypothetical protein